MVLKIEKALSNRTFCKGCGKKIEKDTLKGISEERGFNGYKAIKNYCLACFKTIVEARIKELQEMKILIENAEQNKVNEIKE